MADSNSVSRWRSYFPPLDWLPSYQARWLSFDLIAGITLAAYAVPVSMAYASLAGVPPHFGIYCYLIGGAFYAFFGTSRQLAIGPTSAISMLVGATVAGMAGGDASRWAAIAELAALTVAGFALLAWVLRLSGLVSFISETILVGFKAGAALSIAMTQLPKLFGVKGGGDHFFERAWTLAGQLGDTNLAVLAIGLAALALLLLGEKILPNRPIALFVVVLGDRRDVVVVARGQRSVDRGRAARGLAGAVGPVIAMERCRRNSPVGRCVLPAFVHREHLGGPNARRTTRLRDQPQAGAACPGGGQCGCRLRSGFPRGGRVVAISRKR